MAQGFGCQGHKMRIVIKNVYICHLVTMAGFPLRYMYIARYRKVLKSQCKKFIYKLTETFELLCASLFSVCIF